MNVLIERPLFLFFNLNNQLKILAILEDNIVVIYEKCNHRYANIFLGTGVAGKDDQMHSTVKTKRVRL
jgi:hypothetical protein